MLRTTISITGVVLAGAIFFLYTQPTYDNAQSIQKQIDQYNQALQKANELQQLKQQLISRFNAFNPSDVERLQKLLPDHVDNVRLILDMDNMASRRNMGLKNVDVSGGGGSKTQTVIGALGEGTKKYDSLNVSFATSGTYDDFKKFLGDLESSLRIVDLVSLTLSPGGVAVASSGGAPPVPVYNFALSLRTYWLK